MSKLRTHTWAILYIMGRVEIYLPMRICEFDPSYTCKSYIHFSFTQSACEHMCILLQTVALSRNKIKLTCNKLWRQHTPICKKEIVFDSGGAAAAAKNKVDFWVTRQLLVLCYRNSISHGWYMGSAVQHACSAYREHAYQTPAYLVRNQKKVCMCVHKYLLSWRNIPCAAITKKKSQTRTYFDWHN